MDPREFLKLVVEELRRTTWPSKREVYVMTLAVVLMCIFVGSYIWTLDRVLDYLEYWLLRHL